MANRKRNIQMKFYVTEEEKRLIDEKMKLLPTQRYGAYLRKMAIDGYIIYTASRRRGTGRPLLRSCFSTAAAQKHSPTSCLK